MKHVVDSRSLKRGSYLERQGISENDFSFFFYVNVWQKSQADKSLTF